MKRRAILLVLCIVGLFSTSQLAAAEKAASKQLPAALQAAGVQPAQVLAAPAADALRGSAGLYWVEGTIFVNTAVFQGVVNISARQPIGVAIALLNHQYVLQILP